ncbi:MAG: hypothetical protein D6702_03715 [Planctomycetota bacterium]|nr:MAG: hypothetical protein D6702_03715 [Planctomycetota bacterium]
MPPQTDAFSLDFALEWYDPVGVGSGTDLVFLQFLDAGLNPRFGFMLDDQNPAGPGRFVSTGATQATVPCASQPGSAGVNLSRAAGGLIPWSVTEQGTTSTGDVGILTGSVEFLRIFIEPTTLCGPCGPFLGPCSNDSVRVTDAPTGPGLSVNNLVAGSVATVDVVRATPMGQARSGWSVGGGGPTGTPYGDQLLTRPPRSGWC